MTRNLNEIELFFKGAEVTTTIQPKQVGFKRLTEDAVLPTKAHVHDSGYDLVASEDIIVEPGETAVVKTGIAVELPAGYEATVRPRSGITLRTKLRVQLGTIDQSYTGEIGVIVDNIEHDWTDYSRDDLEPTFPRKIDNSFDYEMLPQHSIYTHVIRKGDRIAQLVITKLPTLEAVEITELGASERGGNGFGSTGVGV